MGKQEKRGTLQRILLLWVPVLLQVTVHFEAVVPRVGHHHMAVGGKGQTLRPIQRICTCVDVGQEGP